MNLITSLIAISLSSLIVECSKNNSSTNSTSEEFFYALHFQKEYILRRGDFDYDTAQSVCESRNASLVTIRSAEESEWIRINVPFGDYFWLGARKTLGGSEVSSRFVDGTSIQWYNWEPFEPNDIGKDCSAIFVRSNGLWYDTGCDDNNSIICERDLRQSRYYPIFDRYLEAPFPKNTSLFLFYQFNQLSNKLDADRQIILDSLSKGVVGHSPVQVNDSAIAADREELRQLRDRNVQLEKENGAFGARTGALQQQIEGREKEIAKLKADYGHLEQEVSKLKLQIERLVDENQRQSKLVQEKQAEIDAVKSDKAELEKYNVRNGQRIEGLIEENNRLKQKNSDLVGARAVLQDRYENMQVGHFMKSTNLCKRDSYIQCDIECKDGENMRMSVREELRNAVKLSRCSHRCVCEGRH